MAAKKRIGVNLGGKLPGRARVGSKAFLRKGASTSASADMEVIIQGYSLVIKQLRDMTPDVLRNALTPVFEKSQKYVPKDTRALMTSGMIEIKENPLRAEISYGNHPSVNAWYAGIVHEYTWVNHKPPTRSKYLQAAMEEELDTFLASITTDYAAAFK
jgi:hypothetical protein